MVDGVFFLFVERGVGGKLEILGVKSLRTFAEMVDLVRSYNNTLVKQGGTLSTKYAALVDKHEEPPKSTPLAHVVCGLVGMDVLAATKDKDVVGLDIVQKVGNFYRFCSTDIGLFKKDIAKPLVDRLDKASKD